MNKSFFAIKKQLLGPYNAAEGEQNSLIWHGRIVTAILVMNVIDGFGTLYWVCSGMAIEANPLMAILIDVHPSVFIIIKLSIVQLGVILLLRNCHRRAASISIKIAFAAYAAVVIYHGCMLWGMI